MLVMQYTQCCHVEGWFARRKEERLWLTTSLVWLLNGSAPRMTVESILSYQRRLGPSRRCMRRMDGKYRKRTIPLWNIVPPTATQNQLTHTPTKRAIKLMWSLQATSSSLPFLGKDRRRAKIFYLESIIVVWQPLNKRCPLKRRLEKGRGERRRRGRRKMVTKPFN